MRILRIHTGQALQAGARIELEEAPSRHLLKVLRRKEGDEVKLFNGDGYDWSGRIAEADGRHRCVVEVGGPTANSTESTLEVHLVQALCRGEKMDWCVQKSVELGVRRIWPVQMARSEVRLGGERARKRQGHWQKVAIAACEQSGRATVPEIGLPEPLEAVVGQLPGNALRIRLDTGGGPGLGRFAPVRVPVVIVTGPEGGLDERDLGILDAAGFQPASLGPRILRSETAGPASLAIMQALHGDMA